MSKKETYYSQFNGWANLTKEQVKLIYGDAIPDTKLRFFDENRVKEMMADFVYEFSQLKDRNHYGKIGYTKLKDDIAKWFEENV